MSNKIKNISIKDDLLLIQTNNGMIYRIDKNKIDYQVEFSKIKYFNSVDKKYHFAVPDFYIPSNNMIVEISLGSTKLLATITKKSHHHLSIKPGDKVFAQIKSVSLTN